MAKRRGIEAACFFCNQLPCECKKAQPMKAPATKAKSAVGPGVIEPSTEVIPSTREVRRITAPPPVGLVISPTLAVPSPPAIKKIERNLSDDEVVEVVAIQNLVRSGLVTVAANPHLNDLAAMILSPIERARAWRVML